MSLTVGGVGGGGVIPEGPWAQIGSQEAEDGDIESN